MSLNGLSASASTVLTASPRSCPLDLEHQRDADVPVRPRLSPRVVSLRGDHDRATEDQLFGMLAHTVDQADADLVVDLHDLTFMDASTVGALVGIRNVLGAHDRHLTVRSPPWIARRVLDICGLSDIIEVQAGGR